MNKKQTSVIPGRFASNFIMSCLLLAGCALSDHKISFKSGGVTQIFAEGKSSIPANFPLPIYPKATTTGSVSASDEQGLENSKFLMLASRDPCDLVASYYKQKLLACGWKINNTQTLPRLINIIASKGHLEANIMLSSDGQKTTINLSVGDEESQLKKKSSSPYPLDKLNPPTD